MKNSVSVRGGKNYSWRLRRETVVKQHLARGMPVAGLPKSVDPKLHETNGKDQPKLEGVLFLA